MKTHILTSALGGQHPNAGQNIQQAGASHADLWSKSYFSRKCKPLYHEHLIQSLLDDWMRCSYFRTYLVDSKPSFWDSYEVFTVTWTG